MRSPPFKYGAPCIVVDSGTATTFDAINSNSDMGGVILPGLLFLLTLYLIGQRSCRWEIKRPQKVIGQRR
jgi:type III pantothenate kinase